MQYSVFVLNNAVYLPFAGQIVYKSDHKSNQRCTGRAETYAGQTHIKCDAEQIAGGDADEDCAGHTVYEREGGVTRADEQTVES